MKSQKSPFGERLFARGYTFLLANCAKRKKKEEMSRKLRLLPLYQSPRWQKGGISFAAPLRYHMAADGTRQRNAINPRS